MSISNKKRYFCWSIIILLTITLGIPMAISAETLKVVVEDQNGNTIPEAKIQIGNQKQTTDESGTATFSDISNAESTLR